MKKGCKLALLFVLGLPVIFIALVASSAYLTTAHPTPTPFPITRYCIQDTAVADEVIRLFREETRIYDPRDMEIISSDTKRPDASLHDQDFVASSQEYWLRFSAKKPGTGQYKKGTFRAMIDDKTCIIQWVRLNW